MQQQQKNILQVIISTWFKFIILLNNFVKMTEGIHWNAQMAMALVNDMWLSI